MLWNAVESMWNEQVISSQIGLHFPTVKSLFWAMKLIMFLYASFSDRSIKEQGKHKGTSKEAKRNMFLYAYPTVSIKEQDLKFVPSGFF